MAVASPAQSIAGSSDQPALRARVRRHLNLLRELTITQFKLKYTGSVLGYVWSLLNPLLLFGIMYVVFTKLFKIQANTPHFTLQLLIGIVIWTFFVETVSVALSAIVANGSLVQKAFFPRPILILAASLSSLMTFVINMTLVLSIAAPFHQVELGLRSFALLPLIAELCLVIFGLSMLLSALFVSYRDLGHIWGVGSQLLFYGSAVIYPLSPAFLGDRAKLLALNPLAQIIEDIRHAVVTPATPWTADILGGASALVPFGIAAGTAVLGFTVFQRLSPHFAENL